MSEQEATTVEFLLEKIRLLEKALAEQKSVVERRDVEWERAIKNIFKSKLYS
jgi:hypothetical protein